MASKAQSISSVVEAEFLDISASLSKVLLIWGLASQL